MQVAQHLLRASYSLRLSGDAAERAFVQNAQLTRFLVGDELGDALQVQRCPSTWTRAGGRGSGWRGCGVVRRLVRWCESRLVGGVLVACHRQLLGLATLMKGEEELFPMAMLCPGLKK